MFTTNTNTNTSADSTSSNISTNKSSTSQVSPSNNSTKPQTYISETIMLARRALNPSHSKEEPDVLRTSAKATYRDLQNRINAYFARMPGLNWSGDETYYDIYELQALLRLVGMAFGMSPKVKWPVMDVVEEREKERVWKKVYEGIDGEVFGKGVGYLD